MEMKKNKKVSLVLFMATFLSQNLLIPVLASVEDQKTYYPSPDPHHGTPSRGSHHGPSHGGSGGGYGSKTPPSGGGGGSYGGNPPANCGAPPSGGGGGHGSYNPPISGGGTPPIVVAPPIVVTPPVVSTPPTTPIIDPGTGTPPTIPGISVPSPPFALDPNSPPFTCDYWRTHPTLIWGLVGAWGTVGGLFGVGSLPGLGSTTTLPAALSNTRADGLGALYREGTASYLNSMATKRFPYTSNQVRDRFVAALSSNKAASAQAQLFKLANEGRIPRAG